ncbi:MAG TPA: hypothetical protein VKE74_06005 [Gemmataceae bacterium]|nr:hypothetical protein [Gemmataceae bacterium]
MSARLHLLILVGTLCLLIAGVTPTRSATPKALDSASAISVMDPVQLPPPGAGVPVAPAPHPKLPVAKFCPENRPPPAGHEYEWEWWGQVTAVDEFSITLLGKGEAAPKRFSVDGTLAGQPPVDVFLGTRGHALSDVRVGDVACIIYYHSASRGILDVCLEVTIYRRPGGKIPPRIDGVPGLFSGHWHEWTQACQDWEEEGIPIPEKYRPVRGLIAVPFPPVAPMPREAGPKPKT